MRTSSSSVIVPLPVGEQEEEADADVAPQRGRARKARDLPRRQPQSPRLRTPCGSSAADGLEFFTRSVRDLSLLHLDGRLQAASAVTVPVQPCLQPDVTPLLEGRPQRRAPSCPCPQTPRRPRRRRERSLHPSCPASFAHLLGPRRPCLRYLNALMEVRDPETELCRPGRCA